MWLDEDSNRNLLNHSLDTIDELHDKAHLRTALYQQKVAQHYNKNIRVRTFKIGDWVLRRVFQNTKEAGVGKLGPNWEGPYKSPRSWVTEPTNYKLETDVTSITAGTPPILSYITSKLHSLFHFRTLFLHSDLCYVLQML